MKLWRKGVPIPESRPAVEFSARWQPGPLVLEVRGELMERCALSRGVVFQVGLFRWECRVLLGGWCSFSSWPQQHFLWVNKWLV